MKVICSYIFLGKYEYNLHREVINPAQHWYEIVLYVKHKGHFGLWFNPVRFYHACRYMYLLTNNQFSSATLDFVRLRLSLFVFRAATFFANQISYLQNFTKTIKIDRRKDKNNGEAAKHPNWLVYIGPNHGLHAT